MRHRALLLTCVLFVLPAAQLEATETGTSNGITGPVDAPFRSGMWWDPARNGSGWDLSAVGDVLFGVWYTYREDGTPTWYSFQGKLTDGRLNTELLSYSWDVDAGQVNAPSTVGDISVVFTHPRLAEVEWQMGDAPQQQVLQPFIFSNQPALADYSGMWYRPRQPGYGLSVQSQGEVTFGVLFYYDGAGQPTWSVGQATQGRRLLPMLNARGACPDCAYQPSSFEDAGQMKLRFGAETSGRVTADVATGNAEWSWDNDRFVMLSNPPSGRPHAAALATLSSPEALKTYFKAGYRSGNGRLADSICFAPLASPSPAEDARTSGSDLSQTNVQEAGVDEADVVKATPEHLYAADYATWELPFDEEAQAWRQTISRYRIAGDGSLPALEGQYRVDLPRHPETFSQISGQGLYRHDTADGNPVLVYLAGQYAGGCFEPFTQDTFVHGFDAGSEDDFEADHELKIQGELIASRRVGDRLFIATGYRPDIYELVDRVLGPDVLEERGLTPEVLQDLFDALEPEDLLPSVFYGDGSSVYQVTPDRIMMPPLSLDRIYPELTTLSVFDLADLTAAPQSVAIMGSVDGLYASTTAVYFASSRHGVELGPMGELLPNGKVDTDLHKFSIAAAAPEYRGSGTVEGVIGFDRERLPWRMGEHNGDLRILTSHGWTERWSELGEHRLSILRESGADDLRLETVAFLPNAQRPDPIGKPGETIHAVRYMGDRGWVVTFQQVDPLYALDLSVATDPRILGELEVEGFSDYLHPVGENLLVGVGMATAEAEFGVWLQGVQLSLFEVSDPASPELVEQMEIGFRGSMTPVLQTHRAFTWLPGSADGTRPPRFVLPVSLHAPEDGDEVEDPTEWQPWETTGILMFNVLDGAEPALELAGQAALAHRDTTDPDHVPYYDWLGPEHARSVIYGNQVLHYFRGGLFQTGWTGGALSPAEGCELCSPH